MNLDAFSLTPALSRWEKEHHPSRGLQTIAFCLLMVMGFGLPAAPSEQAAKGKRPNIILIVADDMGYGDTTINGKSDLQTPALEQIARKGIRFTQFRVNPLCAPTRASLMTGLDSLEAGMWRGPGENERSDAPPPEGWSAGNRRIRDNLRMLPQYLKEAGYATGIFGKWHLGYDKDNVPNARGFDEFVGFLAGSHAYWLRPNAGIYHNGQVTNVTGHTTDLFADNAIEFIKKHRSEPFFCYLPFNAVHGPMRSEDRPQDSGKPEWLAFYEKAGVAQPRRDYNAVFTHADNRIGDVLKTLRELNLETNTFVIFHSDNGGILEKYPSNNGPLRGGKGTTYEGGIRVPALMQWPGVIPPGTTSDAAAAHFDIFATILDASGASIPAKNGDYKLRGISLLPHVRSGGKTPLPDRYIFWDLYGQVGALHGPWKMVGQIGNHHGKFDKAVADTEKAKFELYNLADDIGEKNELSAKYPEIYADLRKRHLEWLKQFAK